MFSRSDREWGIVAAQKITNLLFLAFGAMWWNLAWAIGFEVQSGMNSVLKYQIAQSSDAAMLLKTYVSDIAVVHSLLLISPPGKRVSKRAL